MTGRARSLDRLVRAIGKAETAAGRAQQAGRLRAARRHYFRLLKYSSTLASLDQNAVSLRDLSISYNQCGSFFTVAGQPGQAEAMYQKSLTIISAVAASRPDDPQYRWDVAFTAQQLGDLLSGYTGNWDPRRRPPASEADLLRLADADQAYLQARRVLSSCVADAPANWQYRHFAAIVEERLGFVELQRGGWDEAARRFTAAQTLLRDLIAQAGHEPVEGREHLFLRWKGLVVEAPVPAPWIARRDLACEDQWLGNTALLAGRADAARRHYEDYLSGMEALFAEVSGSLGRPDTWRVAPMVALRDISIAREHLGDLAAECGDTGEAQRQYRESLAALERIPDPLPGEIRQMRRKLASSAS
jgi:tetratricopeptide (TPR) repeat protein